MDNPTLTKSQANRVFDILVEHCGAQEGMRDDFVRTETNGCTEFRFGGSLGFGGKFWNDGSRLYITNYREDETPERNEAMKNANQALSDLVSEWMSALSD